MMVLFYPRAGVILGKKCCILARTESGKERVLFKKETQGKSEAEFEKQRNDVRWLRVNKNFQIY
jgi:hypothetical protein